MVYASSKCPFNWAVVPHAWPWPILVHSLRLQAQGTDLSRLVLVCRAGARVSAREHMPSHVRCLRGVGGQH
eukprot:8973339-Alexandrium_andersonii.AAC.1